MATKNNPGTYDCYANAEPDEPMFILLGRDKHAPALVWLWSVLRELDEETPAKVNEARQCCASMIAWAHLHGRQTCSLEQALQVGLDELLKYDKAKDSLFGTDPIILEALHVLLKTKG